MNLNKFNSLTDLFFHQSTKQNPEEIFLEWLNPINRKKFTWSAWVKRSKISTNQNLAACSHSSSDEAYLYFNASDQLIWQSSKDVVSDALVVDYLLHQQHRFR